MTFLIVLGIIAIVASSAVVVSVGRSRRNEDGYSDGSGGDGGSSGFYFGGSDYCDSGSDGGGGDGGGGDGGD